VGSSTPLTAVLSSLAASTSDTPMANFILNPWLLIGTTVVMSFLMVAELSLFALKFKNFAWKGNGLRYGFLAACVLLLILFRYTGIPIIILLYIVLSIANNLINPQKNEVQGGN
jgi:CDP-diacylglycerol--serine O-phosphatidyltransferase